MENLGTKVVVLGVGGAGCRMLNQLASANPANAELIAVDTDKSSLSSLNSLIKTVLLGQSTAKGETAEEMKAVISSELQVIEQSVSGATMVVVMGSLGGRSASHLIGHMAQLCSDKGLFTLVIGAYPLMTMGGSKGAEELAEDIRGRSSGVVIIDNNLTLEGPEVPMADVFSKINSIANMLVMLLINSVSGIGYMTMSADELMHFFHGNVFFALTASRGPDLDSGASKALEDVHRYMGESGVRRILVVMASPEEASIDEMKGLTEKINGMYNTDAVKWVGAYSASSHFDVLVVSAINEMPLLAGIEQPASQASLATRLDEIQLRAPREEKIESPKQATSAPIESSVEALDEMPKPDEPIAEETKAVSPDGPAASMQEIASVIHEAEASMQEKQAELVQANAKPQVKPPGGPAYFDFSRLSALKGPLQKKPFKSPALVGITEEKKVVQVQKRTPENYAATKDPKSYDVFALNKGRVQKGIASPPEQARPGAPHEDIDGMVKDLTGMPGIPEEPRGYKKPAESQKRMGDYDDLGLKYV